MKDLLMQVGIKFKGIKFYYTAYKKGKKVW